MPSIIELVDRLAVILFDYCRAIEHVAPKRLLNQALELSLQLVKVTYKADIETDKYRTDMLATLGSTIALIHMFKNYEKTAGEELTSELTQAATEFIEAVK